VFDPASDCPCSARNARELLTVNEVDVIFGTVSIRVAPNPCCPSCEELKRPAVLPRAIEGEVVPRNVFSHRCCPNQRAILRLLNFLENWASRNLPCWQPDYV